MGSNLRNKNRKKRKASRTGMHDDKNSALQENPNQTDSSVKRRDENGCAEIATSKVICGPKLSPLNDTDDFILLRCDADCFHLVLPFLSIHLSQREMTLARIALQNLFQKNLMEKAGKKKTFCFRLTGAPMATAISFARERSIYVLQKKWPRSWKGN